MKRRICVRSMVLGAAIMLIGMWVSPLISPPVTAQRNGVFDKIQCREIEVVDKDGETAIRLYTTKHGGDIRMDSKDGRIATMSINERGGGLYLSGKGKFAGGNVSIYTDEGGASLSVEKGFSSDAGIRMFATEHHGRIDVNGKDGVSATMLTEAHGGVVWVSGNGGTVEMGTDEHGGRVDVFSRNKQFNRQAPISDNNRLSNHRATMSVNAFGNGAVSTWDKNGYRQ